MDIWSCYTTRSQRAVKLIHVSGEPPLRRGNDECAIIQRIVLCNYRMFPVFDKWRQDITSLSLEITVWLSKNLLHRSRNALLKLFRMTFLFYALFAFVNIMSVIGYCHMETEKYKQYCGNCFEVSGVRRDMKSSSVNAWLAFPPVVFPLLWQQIKVLRL